MSVSCTLVDFLEVCNIYIMNAFLCTLNAMNIYACCAKFNDDNPSYYILRAKDN